MSNAVSNARMRVAKAEAAEMITLFQEAGKTKLDSQTMMELAVLSYAQGMEIGYNRAKEETAAAI